jgi:hypothetical protein
MPGGMPGGMPGQGDGMGGAGGVEDLDWVQSNSK